MFEQRCWSVRIPFGRAKGGMTFHSLRHTGASRMLNRGADIKTVAEIGNWKNLTICSGIFTRLARRTSGRWRSWGRGQRGDRGGVCPIALSTVSAFCFSCCSFRRRPQMKIPPSPANGVSRAARPEIWWP